PDVGCAAWIVSPCWATTWGAENLTGASRSSVVSPTSRSWGTAILTGVIGCPRRRPTTSWRCRPCPLSTGSCSATATPALPATLPPTAYALDFGGRVGGWRCTAAAYGCSDTATTPASGP